MSEPRYVYRGRNLTTLVLTKVEHVVSLLAERDGCSFEDAYRRFVQSQTFHNLGDTESLLWSESAEFIVDDFGREVAATHAGVPGRQR